MFYTRTSHRWKTLPGSIDRLNAAHLFVSDNGLGIPVLPHVPLTAVPEWLAPYRTRVYTDKPLDDGACHFFLDDYRFETVWTRPQKALTHLRRYTTVLTPDFSLYSEWPLALQQFNVYRSRWCGAFWAGQGLTVIPTVSWSTAASFSFCFLGIPRHSVVAVSAIGVRQPAAKQWFVEGFREMIARLQPSCVLAYGRLPSACYDLASIRPYPTRWEGLHRARQSKSNAGKPVKHSGQAGISEKRSGDDSRQQNGRLHQQKGKDGRTG